MITKNEVEATQGERGKHVNVILRVSLLLAVIGMAAVALAVAGVIPR